jgi:hypothetical protein
LLEEIIIKNYKIYAPLTIAIIFLLVGAYQVPLGGTMIRLWVDMFQVVTLVVIACLILYIFTNMRFFKGIALGGLIIEFGFAFFSLYSYVTLKETKADVDIMYSVILMEILRLVAIYFLITHKHISTSPNSSDA